MASVSRMNTAWSLLPCGPWRQCLPGLAGSLPHVVAAGFHRTPRRPDRPEICRIPAMDGTLQVPRTLQELCAYPIRLMSLATYVKPYFLPPYVTSNISLPSCIGQRHVLRLRHHTAKLNPPGADFHGLRRSVFSAIAFRRTPVPSANSTGEDQAVPGHPARRRVEQ